MLIIAYKDVARTVVYLVTSFESVISRDGGLLFASVWCLVGSRTDLMDSTRRPQQFPLLQVRSSHQPNYWITFDHSLPVSRIAYSVLGLKTSQSDGQISQVLAAKHSKGIRSCKVETGECDESRIPTG